MISLLPAISVWNDVRCSTDLEGMQVMMSSSSIGGLMKLDVSVLNNSFCSWFLCAISGPECCGCGLHFMFG